MTLSYNLVGEKMKIENKEISLHLKDSDNQLFEGWYFKVVDRKISLAIIVGISKTKDKSYAFIQTLDTYTNQSQMIEYDIEDFKWGKDPFYVKLKNNLFTKNEIVLDIEHELIELKGNLISNQFIKLKKTSYAPTIMGPFYYIPFLECNHGIISLKHDVSGDLRINNETFNINGIGYIEKDWGHSFPKDYLWLQSNNCRQNDAHLFLSIANIPFLGSNFNGIIMNLLVEGKQFRVATYYGARIQETGTKDGYHYLVIKQASYKFYLKIKPGNQFELKAPQFGEMANNVQEGLSALAVLLVYKNDKQISKYKFTRCGFELFGNWL